MGSDAAELFQQTLPYELYLKIFGYLTPRDLCQAMRVCKVRAMATLYTHHFDCPVNRQVAFCCGEVVSVIASMCRDFYRN